MNGVILTLVFSLLCVNPVADNYANDYFPMDQAKWSYFESLGTNHTGKHLRTSSHCITATLSNYLSGTFEEIGVHGETGKAIYRVFSSEVQIWYNKKMGAEESDPISPPHFILKIPMNEEPISWTWNDLYYRAQYFSNVKTKQATYPDCILVTQGDANHINLISRKYYARGVGLVLVENFNTEGGLDSLMSFELVKPK